MRTPDLAGLHGLEKDDRIAVGRRLSALRSGLRGADESLDELIAELVDIEAPQRLVEMAEEGRADIKVALGRDDRLRGHDNQQVEGIGT